MFVILCSKWGDGAEFAPPRGVGFIPDVRVRERPKGLTLGESQEHLLAPARISERLALAVDATRLGLWEYDIAADELAWNTRLREMYGVSLDAPVDFELFVNALHSDDRDRVLADYDAALKPGSGDFSFEHRLVRPDGQVRWLLAHGRVLPDQDGKPARVIGSALDITERKQAEDDNRLLLDELNHRVKNSFATVAALLQLRAKKAKSDEAKELLTGAVNQVMSIAQAYAHLYAGGQPRSLDFADYIRDLCNGLAQGLTDGERIRLKVSAKSSVMTTDQALPLGMAVNELVTNAIKHAFPDGRSGVIEVEFAPDGDGWRLIVADNGVGLPETYGRTGGMGAGMVKSFARQAGARLKILDGPGARFEISA